MFGSQSFNPAPGSIDERLSVGAIKGEDHLTEASSVIKLEGNHSSESLSYLRQRAVRNPDSRR
jgi:hypothetical protein